MKKILINTITLTSILGSALMAHADDTTGPIDLEKVLHGKFSGNFSTITDYRFRGISQTSRSPAVQGNLDFNQDSGVKVGFSGSNTDFGTTSGGSYELDLYTSFNKSFDKLSTETGVIRYGYPGAESNLNYDYYELYENLGYDFGKFQMTATFNYSPNFFADSGQAYYPRVGITVPLPQNFALDGWVGRQYVHDKLKYGAPDYTDYEVGLSYGFKGFTVKGSYIGTNLNSGQCAKHLCSGEFLASISKAF